MVFSVQDTPNITDSRLILIIIFECSCFRDLPGAVCVRTQWGGVMSVSLLIGISYYLVKLLLAQSILAQDTFVMCLTHHFLKISTSNCCSANKTKMTPWQRTLNNRVLGFRLGWNWNSRSYKTHYGFWVWQRTNQFGGLQDSGGYKFGGLQDALRILGLAGHEPVLEEL